jgi:hypothetical protein
VIKAKRAQTQYRMNEALMDSEFDFQAFYVMILNISFFTMFYGNAIPLLYFLAIVALCSLYGASFIVFRYFSCKPVMVDHSLNLVILRVLGIALVIHQITSIFFFETEDIFPFTLHAGNGNWISKIGMKAVQGIHFIIFGIIVITFILYENRICRTIKNYVFHEGNEQLLGEQKPKLFS